MKVSHDLPRGTLLIQEAVELHLESLRESGQHVPPPSHTVGYVEVLTPA